MIRSGALVSHLYDDTDEETADQESHLQDHKDESPTKFQVSSGLHVDQQASLIQPVKPITVQPDERPAFSIDRKGSEERCVICSSSDFKYKCPSCLVRTCSLDCFKAHKLQLKCTGLRDSLKFKRLANFDDDQLREDFRFLDDYSRQMNGIKRQKRNIVQSLNDLPNWLKKLKFEANRRQIKLKILPAGFRRRLQNKSTFMYSSKEISWDVELLFTDLNLKHRSGSAEKPITFHVHRVSEKRTLKDLLATYLKPQHPITGQQLNGVLKLYHDAGEHEIAVLIKLSFDHYVQLEPRMSIGDCLKGKSIIEYPTMVVVLKKNLSKYKVVGEKELRDRMQEYADRSYDRLIQNGVVRRPNDSDRSRFGGNRFNPRNGRDSNVQTAGKELGQAEEVVDKSMSNDLNENDLNEKSTGENLDDENSGENLDVNLSENQVNDYYEEQSDDDGPPEEIQTRYVFDNSIVDAHLDRD